MSNCLNSVVHAGIPSSLLDTLPAKGENQPPENSIQFTISPSFSPSQTPKTDDFHEGMTSQWLLVAFLGANDGLVFVASLMIGVGVVNKTVKGILLSGLAGLIARACSMAIGEYISVCTQYDIEVALMKKESIENGMESDAGKAKFPSPLQAAGASALAFGLGAILPLLTAVGCAKSWDLCVGLVLSVSTLALAGFGTVRAVLHGTRPTKSTLRSLIAGWIAILVTYGVIKLFSFAIGRNMEDA